MPHNPLHAGGGAPRFVPIRFSAIKLATDPAYLVKGLLPREGLGVVWGPPKCGKSFWVFDVGMHVALSWDYRDRPVQQGNVVYIACEGERGLGARAEAFRRERLTEGADPPFWLLTTPLDLVRDIDQLIGDVRLALGADQHCALLVVDTLNRSIAGSESRDEDMGAYVKAADKLQRAFGGLVVLVHHCGTNGDRPRGHTSLTGAADVQLAVKRDAAGNISAEVEHMKDGAEGEVIISRLRTVDVGIDTDDDAITSCVVEPADGSAIPERKGRRLPDGAKVALSTLHKAIAEAGEDAPASNHIPPGFRVVNVETWRRYHYVGTASDDQTADSRRKAFQRVRQQLQAQGAIGLHNDLCWVAAHV